MATTVIESVSISGATLATIMQRLGSSGGDCEGMLFGEVAHVWPQHLLDDDDGRLQTLASSSSSDAAAPAPEFAAAVTASIAVDSTLSFYDAAGRVEAAKLRRILAGRRREQRLIGWFVARRNSALRPSMREAAVTAALGALNSDVACTEMVPLVAETFVFFVISESVTQNGIHTHEYRAFQSLRGPDGLIAFEVKPVQIVNLGPGFRSNYAFFSPVSPLPAVEMEVDDVKARVLDGVHEDNYDKEGEKPSVSDDFDRFSAEFDFSAERLHGLVCSSAKSSVSELEELYRKMIVRLEHLAKQARDTSAAVAQQERDSMQLRSKLSGADLK